MAKRDTTKPGTFKSKRTAKAEPFAQHVRDKEDAAAKKARSPAVSGMAAVGRRLVEEAIGKTAAASYVRQLRTIEALTLEDVTATLLAAQVLLADGLKPHKAKDPSDPPTRELVLVDALHLQVKLAKLQLEVAEAYRVRGGGMPHRVEMVFLGDRDAITAAAAPNGTRPADAPAPPTRDNGPGGDKLGVS